jgi:hypothetical protein
MAACLPGCCASAVPLPDAFPLIIISSQHVVQGAWLYAGLPGKVVARRGRRSVVLAAPVLPCQGFNAPANDSCNPAAACCRHCHRCQQLTFSVG